MAHIREPKGIDFIINSEPLTEKERIAISTYINNYKAANISKKERKGRSKRKKANV